MAAQQAPGTAQPPPASTGTEAPSSAWTDVWARAEQAAEAAPNDPGAALEAAAEGDDEAAETTEAPAPGQIAKAKPKANAEPDEADEKNTGAVAPQERLKWREQKRQERAKIEAFRAQKYNELKTMEQQLAERFGKYAQAEKALADGDIDGHFKALYGKPFDEFSKEQLRRKVTPEYQEIVKLRAENKERTEREARERQEAQTRARQAEQQREREQFIAAQAEELKAAVEAGEVIAPLEDPMFHDAVFAKREEYYDGHSTISTAEAAELVVNDLRSNKLMRARYEFLHQIYGGQAALQPEAAQAVATRVGSAPVKRGAAKAPPKAVSQRNAVEASPPGGEHDREKWLRKYSAALRSSSLDE